MNQVQYLAPEGSRYSLSDNPRPDSQPVFVQRTADGRVGLVPEGWMMVPCEPTEAMLGAGKCALDPEILLCRDDALNVWSAMLVASSQVSSDPAPTIPVGMVAWSGGDTAPEDWDGGPWMTRGGAICDWRPLRWYAHPESRYRDTDVIAYSARKQADA